MYIYSPKYQHTPTLRVLCFFLDLICAEDAPVTISYMD